MHLDIEIPVLNPQLYRDYQKLSTLDISMLEFEPVDYVKYGKSKKHKIVFRDIVSNEESHTTILDSKSPVDFQGVISYFAHTIMKNLRLVSGYEHLYELIRLFVRDHLFGEVVDIKSPNTIQNLSEYSASETIIKCFETAINSLTVIKSDSAKISETKKIQNTRSYIAKEQSYMLPEKSVFNKNCGR